MAKIPRAIISLFPFKVLASVNLLGVIPVVFPCTSVSPPLYGCCLSSSSGTQQYSPMYIYMLLYCQGFNGGRFIWCCCNPAAALQFEDVFFYTDIKRGNVYWHCLSDGVVQHHNHQPRTLPPRCVREETYHHSV